MRMVIVHHPSTMFSLYGAGRDTVTDALKPLASFAFGERKLSHIKRVIDVLAQTGIKVIDVLTFLGYRCPGIYQLRIRPKRSIPLERGYILSNIAERLYHKLRG